MMRHWARGTRGMMGRIPDFLNASLERRVVLHIVQPRQGLHPVAEAWMARHVLHALSMHVELGWTLPETGDIGGACPGWHAHSFFITASTPCGAGLQSIASRPASPCGPVERGAVYLRFPVHRVRAKSSLPRGGSDVQLDLSRTGAP